MKLVKTTTLISVEGRAEKIYEIDLCEVGEGKFVVNFRHGRRGAPLADGTKTVLPVSRAEADRIFEKLVERQADRGYFAHESDRGVSGRSPPVTPVRAPVSPATPDATGSLAAPLQRDRILDRLASAASKASVRPPRPSAPPVEGIGGTVVSFSAQQGFGIVQVDGGQSMSFDVAVTEIAPGGLVPGVRVRLEIGDSRIPGRLVVKRVWKEGMPRFDPSRPPPAQQRAGGALERIIWRAGELRISEAEPALLALVESGGALRDYCIMWALGRCGSASSLDTLARIYADANAASHVRRMATLALLMVSERLGQTSTKAEYEKQLFASLPPEIQTACNGGNASEVASVLRAYLTQHAPEAWSVVDILYAINAPVARPAILAELEDVELREPWFYFVRHIFKAAEYRHDAQVFGLLAYRFETTRASFSGHNWSYRYAGQHTPSAYGSLTRRYLRRRVWRTLRRMGQMGDVDYVKLAVGVLLPFSDDDADEPVESENDRGISALYGPWARYWAFNWILYGRSTRFWAKPDGRLWRLRDGVSINAPPPAAREESFPKLWEARPEGLMHLLAESECTPVHELAAKAIRACPRFLAELDIDDVIVLVERPYDVTARLGLELAERRYDRLAPSLPLLVALARSVHEPARKKAHGWIDEHRTLVLADASTVAALVIAPHADTRELARRLLRSTVVGAIGATIVARVVAALLALGDTPEDDARARDATTTLIQTLANHLASVGPEPMKDLLAHKLAGVQELGAELMLRESARAGSIDDEVLFAVLHSEHENVRTAGMRLLAELPDATLAKMELLLARLSADRNRDLRHASRPILKRVCAASPMAAETIARALLEALLRRKLPEGAASHILSILKEELLAIVRVLPGSDVWRLLQSESEHAQELGGLLLQSMTPEKLEIDQIVKLASHDVLTVRQASWLFFDRSLDRVRSNMAEASRILDAKWEDSRAWAFDFFRKRLGEDAFTADVLITILDSVRPDVQAFGRELTTKYFREEDGPTLMTKLSEHPSVAVQLFTTNYLERYAVDRPGLLEGLVPYFTSVLSRPNQGRIAKQRVLAFLEKEGKKNEESARVVLSVLHRVSATMTVETRSAAVVAMVAIHDAQPNVVTPLKIKQPQTRERVRGVQA